MKGDAEDRHFLTGQRTSHNKDGADLMQFEKNRAGGLFGDGPSITALVSKRHLKESKAAAHHHGPRAGLVAVPDTARKAAGVVPNCRLNRLVK